jgi:hypothetical protein
MKWNDAWLSNKDCDGDGALDRHYGFASYIGSGAWEMYSEKMGGPNGYNYKCKIIAVPVDATLTEGIWYAADGKEIGYEIWGEFAVIEEIMTGKDTKGKVLLYKSKDHSGFGGWDTKVE